MSVKLRRRVVVVLFLALLCGAADPDTGLNQTTYVARWVGLRIWYATQLALRLAAKTESPRLFGRWASPFARSFPSDLIQPRV